MEIPGPPARCYAALASANGKIVLFGGVDDPTTDNTFGDTWIFDGSSWTLIMTGTAPPPRARAAMTGF